MRARIDELAVKYRGEKERRRKLDQLRSTYFKRELRESVSKPRHRRPFAVTNRDRDSFLPSAEILIVPPP